MGEKEGKGGRGEGKGPHQVFWGVTEACAGSDNTQQHTIILR